MEVGKEDNTKKILTLSLRNAAKAPEVAIGRFKIAVIGRPAKPVLLNSGAVSMILLMMRIIFSHDQIVTLSELSGKCFCCPKI